MTDQPLNIAHLSEWIGREQVIDDVLTPALVDRFNATFDRSADSAIAPQLIHLCLGLPAAATQTLGPDGHPERGGFLPPVPLPRRMWAGGAFRFHAPLRIGSNVQRRSRIAGVAAKQGRSGPLCFVTVDHQILQDGALAITERHDIVYRDLTGEGGVASDEVPAPTGAILRRISPTPTLLFRYSALTFNGHRIHYDRPYATGPEGYPGLVVHGPIQATLLCQLAADLHGAPPVQFEFRSLSPLFDTADFTLNADRTATGYRLWTASLGGPVAMEATAQW